MKIDLALILTALAALTGLIWLVDSLFFARKRKLMLAQGDEVVDPVLVEYAKSLFPIIFLVLGLRSFVAEPFRIPSSSMMPTLLVGDFILVNKFSYGLRLPVLNTKVVPLGEPRRGDVVVFRYPGMGEDDVQKGMDYIKRVVGLPGDRISFSNQTLYVNDQAVAKVPVGAYVGTGKGREMTGATLFENELPGRTHQILQASPYGDMRLQGNWTVPQGRYFVMGDNRDHSSDSRVWGFVPEDALVGKAFLIWLNCEGWFCSGAFDYTRIGDTIR
ncbi:MAG: signal peptidase I [Lysobacteraceae bacterium]|nr:MAG: signal peptidase I [Xanthomonadaceae bacterium]